MISLNQVRHDYPWNANMINETDEIKYRDKEVYTYTILPDDQRIRWYISIPEPPHGSAVIGYRILTNHVYNGINDIYIRQGYTNRVIFDRDVDTLVKPVQQWNVFPYPLVHRLFALSEDGIELVIKHTCNSYGKVEILYQKFNDIRNDDTNVAYAFISNKHIKWVLTPKGTMFVPSAEYDSDVYRGTIKVLLPMTDLLYNNELIKDGYLENICLLDLVI